MPAKRGIDQVGVVEEGHAQKKQRITKGGDNDAMLSDARVAALANTTSTSAYYLALPSPPASASSPASSASTASTPVAASDTAIAPLTAARPRSLDVKSTGSKDDSKKERTFDDFEKEENRSPSSSRVKRSRMTSPDRYMNGLTAKSGNSEAKSSSPSAPGASSKSTGVGLSKTFAAASPTNISKSTEVESSKTAAAVSTTNPLKVVEVESFKTAAAPFSTNLLKSTEVDSFQSSAAPSPIDLPDSVEVESAEISAPSPPTNLLIFRKQVFGYSGLVTCPSATTVRVRPNTLEFMPLVKLFLSVMKEKNEIGRTRQVVRTSGEGLLCAIRAACISMNDALRDLPDFRKVTFDEVMELNLSAAYRTYIEMTKSEEFKLNYSDELYHEYNLSQLQLAMLVEILGLRRGILCRLAVVKADKKGSELHRIRQDHTDMRATPSWPMGSALPQYTIFVHHDGMPDGTIGHFSGISAGGLQGFEERSARDFVVCDTEDLSDVANSSDVKHVVVKTAGVLDLITDDLRTTMHDIESGVKRKVIEPCSAGLVSGLFALMTSFNDQISACEGYEPLSADDMIGFVKCQDFDAHIQQQLDSVVDEDLTEATVLTSQLVALTMLISRNTGMTLRLATFEPEEAGSSIHRIRLPGPESTCSDPAYLLWICAADGQRFSGISEERPDTDDILQEKALEAGLW